MPTQNPGQTRLIAGKFGDECTLEADLIANQALKPVIKKMMYQVDKRQLTTLITSGAVGPYGINLTVDEKFGKAPEGTPIGASSMQFRVMGRLNQASTIISQYGSSGSDGSFQLILADKLIYKGQNCQFQNSTRYQALCMAEPTKVAAGWLYSFQHKQGEVFVYATHATPAGNGTPKVMGASTNYGEASEKGYSRDKHPDTFILDMTTQRKTISLSGDALNDVLWYEYEGSEGITRGWKFEKVRQGEAMFAWENEFEKIFGISSMKNPDGSRRAISPILDSDTGNSITAGDGIEEQISGGNEFFGSGVDGMPTEDDFIDIFGVMTKQSNSTSNGVNLFFMTGYRGWSNFQRIAPRITALNNAQIFQKQEGGDAKVTVGYTYTKIVWGGSSLTVCIHPLFDDTETFGVDPALSGTYIGGDLGDTNSPNMEIIPKGAFGGNRSDVRSELQGMTGGPGTVVSQKDAWTWQILKQDLIAIYNTKSWCVVRPTAA